MPTDLTFPLMRTLELAQEGQYARATRDTTERTYRERLEAHLERAEAEIVALATTLAPKLTAKGGTEEMLVDAVKRRAEISKALEGA